MKYNVNNNNSDITFQRGMPCFKKCSSMAIQDIRLTISNERGKKVLSFLMVYKYIIYTKLEIAWNNSFIIN